MQSTSQEQLINAYFGSNVSVRSYQNSTGERDLDLKAGRIDAGFDSGVYGTTALAKPGNEDLEMSGSLMKGRHAGNGSRHRHAQGRDRSCKEEVRCRN